MPRHVPITADEEAKIIAALEKKPHATFVARKTGWSYSAVWRVAARAGIELTADRVAKSYKRLSAAKWRKIAVLLDDGVAPRLPGGLNIGFIPIWENGRAPSRNPRDVPQPCHSRRRFRIDGYPERGVVQRVLGQERSRIIRRYHTARGRIS
jgi:hypothetical protein